MNSTTNALEVMKQGSVSFTLASRLFPGSVREDVALLYHWLRACDDAVDEGEAADAPERARQLSVRLDRVLAGEPPSHPEDVALERVLSRHAIPPVYLHEFLAGMTADANGQRPATVRELDEYCYRVAGTVGLMMCHLLGVRSAQALRYAAHMGMAMQLTNICRDIHEDWRRGRLYVPSEMLTQAGAADLPSRVGGVMTADDAQVLSSCAAQLWARAVTLYRSGDRGLSHLPWRASLAVAAARLIYAAIGHALQRRGFTVLAGRVVIPTVVKVGLLVKAVVTRGLSALAGGRGPSVPSRAPLLFTDLDEAH